NIVLRRHTLGRALRGDLAPILAPGLRRRGGLGVDDLGRLGLVLVDLGLLAGGDQQDAVALVGLGEDDAHGGAALGRDLGDLGAHHTAALHHHQQLVRLLDHGRAHQVAAVVRQLRDPDAEPAPALEAVLLDAGALGEAAVGDGDDEAVGAHHVHGQQPVVVAELHAGHAAGGATGGAQGAVVGGHPHGLAVAGDQQDLVVAVDRPGGDHTVRVGAVGAVDVTQVDGDDATGAARVEGRHGGLLHQPGLGREHRVLRVLVAVDREHRGDVLIGLEGHQVRHVLALRVPRRLGQLITLGAVDAALVGEEQQPAVGGGGEEVLDHVVLAQRGPPHPLAAAFLGSVLVLPGALDVAAPGDGDDHVLLGDEVLHRHVAGEGEDLGAAVVAVAVDDLGELLGDDVALLLRIGQDRGVLLDQGL